ncbi:MAG: glycoside hydrolase family 5 protein [Thermoguttaceae bacterium]|nr:glycoside hydrolase family 5 protein [Thermoguttaceae bacterium]MDW8037632.1 hypothetical protein [Thermoguttaceae bacterium]
MKVWPKIIIRILATWCLVAGGFWEAIGQRMVQTAEKAPSTPSARAKPMDDGGPIRLHPENGHYFLWRGKPTVLIGSGEHYGAVLNLDFDFHRYFATLAADGLNHTRTFSGTYRELPSSFGITENTLAPKPNRYIAPWARSTTPGYYDGGNKFDLSRWDEAYFRRLHEFMRAAQRSGVVVEMNLFCPLYEEELWKASPMNIRNNINDIGDCPRTEVFTLKHPKLLEVQIAVTRKIVQELNPYDNLYYEVCNEPYFGGVQEDWQRRITDVIVETERELPNKHLISWNIANGRKKVENPHPAVSIFNFHYCVPPDTVAMNYHLNKVIGENETGFRGKEDVLYRTEAWAFILAGGGLFSHLDYSFTPRHPDGTFRDYKSPGGGSPELRKQLSILKQFIERFDFIRMRPDSSFIKQISEKLSVQALVQPGRAYAIYLHVPLPEKPKNLQELLREQIQTDLVLDLPAGSYRAEWVDTKTGQIADSARFEHAGGLKKLRSPVFANDIALGIQTLK